jgi:hypothetical protein
MAAPQQRKRTSINPPTVEHADKIDNAHYSESGVVTPPKQVEDVKEKGPLAVYQAMLEMLRGMYDVSLGLENDEDLAALLKSVEGVQVQLSVIIGRLREEEEIAKSVKEYEERSVKDDED